MAGALVGLVWAALNSVYPNSVGATALGNFEVLHPWLHRLEHASFALLVYTGLYAGLLGFYRGGAIGRGWPGKVALGLATVGVVLASLSSLSETVVLQWNPADAMRDVGFALLLLLLCPLLFGIAALVRRAVPLRKRLWPLALFALPFVAALLIGGTGMNQYLAFIPILLGWGLFGYAVYTEERRATGA